MRVRAAALLVFAAALLLYLPAVRNGFAYDDHMIVRINESVHDLSNAHRLFTQPYWPVEDLGLYRPLVLLGFAVDWAISGGSPGWFHFVNALWNAAASALVFLFLISFVHVPVAALAALVFAAHPVHVEAVANIVGRAEVMAAVFSLVALVTWVRSDPDRPLPPARLGLVLTCYVLALLSKENAIMLPALLALADIARGALTPAAIGRWARCRASAFAMMAAAALTWLAARGVVLGELGPDAVDPTLDVATATIPRILTALQAWPTILRLLIVPYTLLADYGPGVIMPALGMTAAAAAGALVFAGLVAGGTAAWLRGRGRTAAVLLFLPVALLPTSNLIVPIGIIVAERTLYLPSLVVPMALAFAAASWWQSRHRTAVIAAASIVILLFSARTLLRIPVWDSTASVHAALLRDRPDAFRGHWYLARVAVNRNAPREALERYSDALGIWPYRQRLVLEAAAYAAQSGDLPFAARLTTFALSRWPNDVRFLRIHAAAHLDLGDTATARSSIDRALRIAPEDSTLLAMRSAILPGLRQ
ncbi:MAG: hypothetical protein WEF86_10420 [Gemmatimonadota bacterium]